MIGAAVLAWQGYRGLMVLTAVVFALVAVPLLLLGATPAAPPRRGGRRCRHPVDPADAAGGGQLHAVPYRDALRLGRPADLPHPDAGPS
jgi:hypothetical protein